MEKDFRKGMPVSWNTLEKVVRTTASGREKVDYERVTNMGVIVGLNVAPPGHNEPGTAMVKVEGRKNPCRSRLNRTNLRITSVLKLLNI